jgi:DNA invertase Pin-like site-specific DNA recombinase
MIEPGIGAARPMRCAIYTRKSTEEGLEQAFNSLQAQRESAEAYIASQQARGWVVVPEQYNDGGFSGSHIERPALQRLLSDLDLGGIDCVMVYKVDRLSRSLLDFARLMERFDRTGVSFVSVTQEFNTTTSMGRLTLHILLSFAQFEREIIGERTRDKLSAARRKGKWIGGWPVLGYDVDPKGGRLVMNSPEAEQVRQMYRIAAEAPSLEAAWQHIQADGYQTKAWSSRAGKSHLARPIGRMTLRLLLSNVLYKGAVSHKGSIYPGEQEPIVDQELWEQVYAQLELRSAGQRGKRHASQSASLTGLLYCAECGSAMQPKFTTRHGRRYKYYSCQAARRKERKPCSQYPAGAADLETSLLRNLQPSLGNALTWEAVRQAIGRVEYEAISQQVSIAFHDGTRLECTLPVINRPGLKARATASDSGRVPRVSRLMALAIKFERLVRQGTVRNFRELAEAGRVSRARMSQIMRLCDLAPEIQESLLFLPKTLVGPDWITERTLRQIARSIDWEWQKKQFRALAGQTL